MNPEIIWGVGITGLILVYMYLFSFLLKQSFKSKPKVATMKSATMLPKDQLAFKVILDVTLHRGSAHNLKTMLIEDRIPTINFSKLGYHDYDYSMGVNILLSNEVLEKKYVEVAPGRRRRAGLKTKTHYRWGKNSINMRRYTKAWKPYYPRLILFVNGKRWIWQRTGANSLGPLCVTHARPRRLTLSMMTRKMYGYVGVV